MSGKKNKGFNPDDTDNRKSKKVTKIIYSSSDTSSLEEVSRSSNENDNDQLEQEQNVINKLIIKKNFKSNNEIFKELIKRQLPNIPSQWKLNINDMKRICKYINTSIFDPSQCCLWNGYITNMNNSNKGTYVNFYFKNKKVALHRLLYSNFVAPLNSSEYLKFNCDNKGICCNINHYEKYKYSKNTIHNNKKEPKKESKKNTKNIVIISADDDDSLHVDFE